MRVTKIKIKSDRVFVEYDKIVIVENQELLNKYSIDSPEQPIGAFKDAFQKMDFFLIELCELADKQEDIAIMCQDVTITGLTFKYDDGELSAAIITGTRQLAYSNSPLVLNTPIKSVIVGDDGFDRMKHHSNTCVAALAAVINHAKDYVRGERLQIEMELKDEGHTEEGPKIDETARSGDTTPVKEEVLEDKPEHFKKNDQSSKIPKTPQTSDIEE